MTYFEHGVTYIAGIDKPAIVSVSTIREAVADEGFQVLGVYTCDQIPSLPFAVPGKCGDEWDYIGIARRTGPSKWIDVPDRARWIVAIPPVTVTPSLPARPGEPPPPTAPGPTVVLERAGMGFRPTGVTWVAAGSLLAAGLLGYFAGRRR